MLDITKEKRTYNKYNRSVGCRVKICIEGFISEGIIIEDRKHREVYYNFDKETNLYRKSFKAYAFVVKSNIKNDNGLDVFYVRDHQITFIEKVETEPNIPHRNLNRYVEKLSNKQLLELKELVENKIKLRSK